MRGRIAMYKSRIPLFLLATLVPFVCACAKQAVREQPPAAKPASAESQPAKKTPKEPEKPAEDKVATILDAAIEAAGGVEKVEAVRSFKADIEGEMPLGHYTATNTWRAGQQRMDIRLPGGGVTLARGKDSCWAGKGPVIMPVAGDDAKYQRALAASLSATMLWPIREMGWKVEATSAELGEKKCDALIIDWPDLAARATMIFDADTHLPAKLEVKIKVAGQQRLVEMSLAEYKEFCGIKMASRRSSALNGKPMNVFDLKSVDCSEVDEAVFAQPEQVKHGTIMERDTAEVSVVCHVMKGSYSGFGDSFGKLLSHVSTNKYGPRGLPLMIYVKGPPRVKKQKRFVTQVCLPVTNEAPDKPRKKGEFVFKKIPAGRALAAYGLGEHFATAPELAKALLKEARKKKLKTRGPLMHITYMDPASVPEEELVSEILLPIAAKSGK